MLKKDIVVYINNYDIQIKLNLKKRNRTEKRKMREDYVIQLHHKYYYLTEKFYKHLNIPIVMIDNSQSLSQNDINLAKINANWPNNLTRQIDQILETYYPDNQ